MALKSSEFNFSEVVHRRSTKQTGFFTQHLQKQSHMAFLLFTVISGLELNYFDRCHNFSLTNTPQCFNILCNRFLKFQCCRHVISDIVFKSLMQTLQLSVKPNFPRGQD